jgi:hypothetical protein
MDELDLDQLRIDTEPGSANSPSESDRLPRHRPGEKFLKGPIPLNWIVVAGRLKGKTLHLGCLLWLKAGIEKARTISFNAAQGEVFGMSKDSARRALRRLEGAGLISTRYLPGRCLEVTILEAKIG